LSEKNLILVVIEPLICEKRMIYSLEGDSNTIFMVINEKENVTKEIIDKEKKDININAVNQEQKNQNLEVLPYFRKYSTL